MTKQINSSETVGRTYAQTRYGVHSRRVGGDGAWFGLNNYKTRADAERHMRSVGEPILDGMVSVNGGRKDRYEYRIVRLEMQCTVEHVEEQMV